MTSKRRARKGTFRRAVSAVTLIAFVFTQTGALAGPVADPAAPIGFRPTVTTAPSGASVVNIVAPSAAGTSHNKYSGFDVDAPGVVLNNSLTAGASALAGNLGANPNLSGAFATVILNEVTGSGASRLTGPLEVFGAAAAIIIANPNGIGCAGCSFLNAPRVTLTTGVPFYTGSLLGLNVTGGALGVSGAGLDAAGLQQLDLVARTIAIDAPVSGAQRLNLLAGKLAYDYASGSLTPAPGASGSGYAIDASSLGGLSAGRLLLQATDAGVGVRALGGVGATAEDIVLSASGEVRIANATAARDLLVTAGAFHSSASASLGRDFIATVGSLTNEGSIAAGRAVDVTAAGGITNNGGLEAGEAAQISVAGSLVNRGSLAAGNALTVSAESIANLAGAILARAGALSLTATGAIDNSAGSLSGAEVRLQGASLTNANGFVFAEGNVALNFSGPLSNAAGQILTASELKLAAGALDNRGGIVAGRDARLEVASLDNRASGRLAADRDLALDARGTLDNSGGLISANRSATVSAGEITNQGGSLTAVGNLDLTATTSLAGAGVIGANEAVRLRGGTLAPGGTLDAGGLEVEALAFANAAAARIFGDAQIRAGSFANSGSIGSAGAVTIDVTGSATNSGVVAANTDLAIAAASIANLANASLLALGNATLRAPTITNTGGTVQAGGGLTIEAGTLANQRGPITTVYSATDARGSAGGLFGSRPTGELWQSWSQVESTPPAQLLAGNDLVVNAAVTLNEASLMAAGGDILVAGDAFTNRAHQLLVTTYRTWYRWKSKLLGRKEAVTDVYYQWNGTPATVQAGGELTLALAGTLENSGNLIAGSVNAKAQTINTGIFDYYAQTPPTVEPKSAIDLSRYGSLPVGPNQLFTERRDPASRYLIGVDPSLPLSNLVLLSPEYFASLLGQAEAANRFYADPLAEAALLRSAALAQTGRAFFVPEAKTDEEERRALYEAALRFAREHPGLVLGEAFTESLIASLDAPVLWYVRNAEGILVPVVYLPALARENLANVQGGLIQASEIQLAAIAKLDNSGFIAGSRITLDADSVINQKRSADVGHIVRHEKDYWYEITGSTVQPGGFVSAAELSINANRLTSISGEFYQAGEDASGRLEEAFGANASFSQNQDRLNVQTHQYQKDPLEQVVVAAVAIAVSMWVGPMIAAALNAAAETAAAAAISEGLVAGTITSGAEALAVQQAVYAGFAFAPGSVATAAVSTGLTGMATSSATQLLATGEIDLGAALKASLTSGLTAGATQGLGIALDNQTLLGDQQIPGGAGELVKAGAAATELGDKLLGYTLRAAITGGVNKGVYGAEAGSFGTAFVNSWVASASADAVSFVGGNTEPLSPENIAAHALVGCAGAAAAGNDCGAGALGAAAAAVVNPVLDQFTSEDSLAARNAQLAAATTTASGLAAAALGADVATAIGAAQNETLNNYLSASQKTAMLRDLEQCTNSGCTARVRLAWEIVDKKQDLGLTLGLGGGLGYGGYEMARGIVELMVRMPQTLAALSAFVTDEFARIDAADAAIASYEERIDRLSRAYEDAGWDGSVTAGVELGRLIFDIGFTASGVGAAAKLSAKLATVGGKEVRNLIARVETARYEAPFADLGAETKRAGSIRNVNPTRGIYNCVNCVIATDATLAGKPASALPGNPVSISALEQYFGGTFVPVSGRAEINRIMTSAGPGSRGIVFGSRGPGQMGHVFNVVNQHGTIRFLDGQIGGPASFRGYLSFELLRTN